MWTGRPDWLKRTHDPKRARGRGINEERTFNNRTHNPANPDDHEPILHMSIAHQHYLRPTPVFRRNYMSLFRVECFTRFKYVRCFKSWLTASGLGGWLADWVGVGVPQLCNVLKVLNVSSEDRSGSGSQR